MAVTLPDAKSRIIVALDTQRIEEVTAIVTELAPHVGLFKAGFELTNAVGTERALRAIRVAGGEVFADLKLHDIPNTVAKAVQAVADFGPRFTNMHIQSGSEAMQKAVSERGECQLLGVSVLTSLDPLELLDMFVRPYVEMAAARDLTGALGAELSAMMLTDGRQIDLEVATERRKEYVRRLVLGFAEKAAEAGLDGLICSPQELEYLWAYGSPAVQRLIKVVPGIRMSDGQVDDQNRVGTPYQAIVDGADYLVIGRPILQSPDRVAAAKAFAREIESALKYLDG